MKTTQFLCKRYIKHAPLNLQEFIAWVQGFLDDVSDEYQASAEIEISDVYGTITISYERDETAREEEKRIRIANDVEQRERSLELRELARLKAKYEGAES